MKVKALEIKGFRGIADLRLDFDPRLTVVVGENGVGKTSVLDALAIVLDQYVARFVKATPQKAERLRDTDVNIATKETSLSIAVDVPGRPPVHWLLRKQQRTDRILQLKSSEFDDLNALVKAQVEARGEALDGETLMIYYGQRRAVLDVPQRLRGGSQQTPDAAFSEALKLGHLNFREFVAWFRDREHDEIYSWMEAKSYYQPDKQLEAVRRAMTTATGLRDVYYRGTPSGLHVWKPDGSSLRVDQLSSGEQTYLALAGDLARRLAMLNPNAEDPLAAPGIVLIDEIELHLHPHWQRQIIPWLMETFTNCQFVITTHSPQVLGRVHADNIRVLKQENGRVEVFTVTASHGRDSNYILVSVLGGDERDVDIKAKFAALDQAIAQSDLARARILLAELRDNIEGGAPELAIAEHRLERKLRGRQE